MTDRLDESTQRRGSQPGCSKVEKFIMSVTCDIETKLNKGVVLLAPPNYREGPFRHRVNPDAYDRFLAGTQRLRGEIYARDGAIEAADLTDDGRHVQPIDARSWHLLIVNDKEMIQACIRYCVHSSSAIFSDLEVSRGSIPWSEPAGTRIRRAVQSQIEEALSLGFSYVEVGGWAITEELRCTTEVLRMVLMIYAFGQLKGGALGLSTATTRHHSSSILRRLGGSPLVEGGEELPAYFDSKYGCEMEFLTFDSTKPNPRYSDWIEGCHQVLSNIEAIGPRNDETDLGSLLRLKHALSESWEPRMETEVLTEYGGWRER
jgi:hypothetical protein